MRNPRLLALAAILAILPLIAGCSGGCGSTPNADNMGFNDPTTGPCKSKGQHCKINTDCCGALTCDGYCK
ncbi:MAG: hypothetical protein WC881_03770 [Elusimicrobiota bacterium]|jgi:hypothetical protein